MANLDISKSSEISAGDSNKDFDFNKKKIKFVLLKLIAVISPKVGKTPQMAKLNKGKNTCIMHK